MFTGKEPHDIPAEKARGYIRKWREKAPKGKAHGGFISREILDRMLAQPDCVGLRIYHATHEKGHDTFVVVGTDKEGTDLWRGAVAEELWPCPPYCPRDEA